MEYIQAKIKLFIQHCNDGRQHNKTRMKVYRYRPEAELKGKLFQLLSLQYV